MIGVRKGEEPVIESLALHVVQGPDEGRVFELTELPVTVGRHPESTIPLSDGSISRHQFRILSREGEVILEDAGSLNGTWVNGEKVSSIPLKEGDRIEFGNTIVEARSTSEDGEFLDDTDKLPIAHVETGGPVEPITRFKDEEYLNISAKKEDFEKIYRSYLAFSALYEIDRLSHPGADLEEALTPIVDFILKFTRADRACLLVRQRKGGRLSPELIRYRSRTETPPEPFPINRSILKKVISKGEAVRSVRKESKGEGFKSILCAPLKHRRGLSGVLYLEAGAREGPPTKDDLDLFSALSFKAGSALESALLYRDLRDLFSGAIETLVDTIQEKDRYTSGHSRRVSAYAAVMAGELDLSRLERRNLRLAAVLHDIGKVGWPDRLLYNTDDLTPEELTEIQAHPKRGADLLERLPFMDDVIPGIRSHHEAWDGSGYPSGLKGEEIPLFARMIAVADTYDAVTTDRPYQKRVGPPKGLEILEKHSGSRLDPELVSAFARSYPKLQKR